MKDWLDTQLSRVTMYRLVTLCLTALLAVSGILAITGYLGFSLLELGIGIVIFLGSVYGAGRLFGWLFSVRPHGESSIITALILSCLFLPPHDLRSAIALVVVGVIASATKYLLAIRGRHIFNPAAIAAAIASITGLAGAGWWVATPVLLPVTATIAILILYKTRRLLMGVVFVVVASLCIGLQAVSFGTDFIGGVLYAYASWPIVFLAGVMLSEPLTQPPRRYQQLGVAVIVAVLLIAPLKTPVVAMTPALALVIGNAVAWWWGARRRLTLRFVERKQLTPSSYEFIFAGTVPFTAGQYIELTLPHKSADSRGRRRVFTIAASPGDKNIRFGIKIPERHSTFKQALMSLREGTVVQATRVAGDFVLSADTNEPVVFIAGGIGITPLISYLRARPKHDITVIYAVTSPAEIAYRDVLAVSGAKVTIVVPGGKADVPGGWSVIDAPFVSEDVLKTVKDMHKRTVYISGPPLMVNAVKRAARQLGARKIKTDHFSGY